DPAQPYRYISRQRDRSTLDGHTTVSLIELPVRIQTPQKSIARIWIKHLFFRRARVFHFRDVRAVRAAEPAFLVDRRVMYVVLGIENYSDNFLLQQPQKHLEVVL